MTCLSSVGISHGVAVAGIVIFLFRATPTVGQGYSYWAIDRLGFDQQFLGLLAQVSAVVSLAGLLLFRSAIVKRPVFPPARSARRPTCSRSARHCSQRSRADHPSTGVHRTPRSPPAGELWASPRGRWATPRWAT